MRRVVTLCDGQVLPTYAGLVLLMAGGELFIQLIFHLIWANDGYNNTSCSRLWNLSFSSSRWHIRVARGREVSREDLKEVEHIFFLHWIIIFFLKIILFLNSISYPSNIWSIIDDDADDVVVDDGEVWDGMGWYGMLRWIFSNEKE